MRKGITYSLLLILAPVITVLAADPDSTGRIESPQRIRHVIKTNPFPIIWSSIPLTSEFRYVQEVPVARFQSTQIGFSYLGKSPVLSIIESTNRQLSGNQSEPRLKVSGFRMQFCHKFFLMRDEYAPLGPYIAPHISYATAKFSTDYARMFDYYVQATHFNVNVLLGYQVEGMDWYVVDIFTGLGYKKNTWEQHNPSKSVPFDVTDFKYYNSPVKLTLGFNIGIAF